MIRVSILAMVLASSAVCAGVAGTAPAQTVVFRAGASSSGWIAFAHYTNLGIYVPVKIDGRSAIAWLWGGPSSIDSAFATSIGLAPDTAAGTVPGVEIQAGDLTLLHAAAKPDDLQANAYARIVGQPLVFRLGEELFDQVAVDIDFANRRVAFLDPNTVSKPAGAIEVPLIEQNGERVVPVSVDGAAPAQFEFELGNMNGPLMVTPAYAQTHELLESRPTSQRLSGPFSETVVSVDHLNFAGVDFASSPIAIVPDSQLPPASIVGGIGLPLLEKFRLIIDYPHNRLYAIPNDAAVKVPIAKDRIGLLLGIKGSTFVVAFVAPKSPAAAAGLKKGDEIALIDGKGVSAWSVRDLIGFQMADTGTTHVFTMADGTVLRVTAADFF
jgi:PDZ domain